MQSISKIWVTGSQGLVGSAVCKKLIQKGFTNLLTPSRQELNLLDSYALQTFLKSETPEYIIAAAAKTGGIAAQLQEPATFIYENLIMQQNLIHQAYCSGVKKLLFVASSAVYSMQAPQPFREDSIMCGPLEESHASYSMAKLCGIKMCEAYHKQYGVHFFSVLPCNLFGIGQRYDRSSAQVVPSLIEKFHTAKIEGKAEVEVWGSGNARRELLYADDFAEACLLLMLQDEYIPYINIGYGTDVSIRELAEMIKEIVGYTGRIQFDVTKPEGAPMKLLDITRIQSLGWKPTTDLFEGLQQSYADYLKQDKNLHNQSIKNN